MDELHQAQDEFASSRERFSVSSPRSREETQASRAGPDSLDCSGLWQITTAASATPAEGVPGGVMLVVLVSEGGGTLSGQHGQGKGGACRCEQPAPLRACLPRSPRVVLPPCPSPPLPASRMTFWRAPCDGAGS